MSNPKKNEVQIGFAIDKDLKERFFKACKEEDTTISRELRKLVKDYLEKRGE